MITVILRCVNRCNFNCVYCFQRDTTRAKGEMSIDQLGTIFSKVKYYLTHREGRGESVTFSWTGGEPLILGPDYFQKALDLEYSTFKNMTDRVWNDIQTNGSLISKRFIEVFREFNIAIGISTDVVGGTRLRGKKDMSALVFDKMKLMKREGYNFGCIVVVTKKNIGHLRRIYRTMRDEGIPFHFSYLKSIYLRNYDDYDASLIIAPSELADGMMPVVREYFIDRDKGRIKGYFIVRNIDDELHMAISDERPYHASCEYRPYCSVNYVCFEPDGSAYPCPSSCSPDAYLGNIYKQSFGSLMKHPFRKELRRRQRRLKALCSDCDLLPGCSGGCMAQAYQDGDMLGISHYDCEYRRIIAKRIRDFVKSRKWSHFDRIMRH